MDKQQAVDNYVDSTGFEYPTKGLVKNSFINGWEAHEAQLQNDPAVLKISIEKILTEEITYHPQVDGFIIHGAIDKLIALFQAQSPSDAVAFQDWIEKNNYQQDEVGQWFRTHESNHMILVAGNTTALYKLFNTCGAVPKNKDNDA